MRTSMRIGIVGSSVAVAGSAALAAFAPGAGASSGYDSVGSATVGSVTIAGHTQNLASVTATTGNSPASENIGSGQLLAALKNVPTLGPALAAGFQNANPGNTDLVTESATASADGHSTACAAVLSADCTTKPMSLILKLGLSDLVSSLPSNPITGTLPDPLSAYQIVLTLNGPRASCAVGPAGSGQVYATDNPAGATIDIQANGKSVLPNGPVVLSGGDVFKQLFDAEKSSPLAPVLTQLEGSSPLSVTIDPNSRKYISGSKATAIAGELGLSSGSTTIFDVTAAKASCGPNTETASTSPAPSSPAPSSQTSPATSGEKPLSGIQTDEGRSAAAGNSYLALNGMP